MPLWDINHLGVHVQSRSAVGTWSHCHCINPSSKLTHQYIWSKLPQGNWIYVTSMPSIMQVLFHLFKVRKCKLGIIKLWLESHAFHRHHWPVIDYFVISDTKFWLLRNQVDVNMRPKEETLGFASSLKMYFHFYMKIVLDMTGSEDIY